MLTRITRSLSKRSVIFVMTLSALAGIAASQGAWTTPLDHATEGLRNEILSHEASGDVVVVAVDAKSLDEIAEWPWPRRTHGKLVDRLMAEGASNVVLDITFKTKSADPEDDRLLAAALKRASGRAVLPATRETNEDFTTRTEILPTPELAAAAPIASIWVRLDEDNLVRRSPWSIPLAGKPTRELGVALAQGPLREGSFAIDWSIDPASFPTYSYSDILSGNFPKGALQGKRVIVGTTAPTFGDFIYVPTQGRIPGLYVQATAAETIIAGAPVDLPPYAGLALALAAVLASLMAGRQGVRFAALGATLVATVAGPILLFRYAGVSAPSSAPLVALLAAIIAQAALETVTSVHRRLVTDAATGLPNMQALALEPAVGKGPMVAVHLRNQTETTAILGADRHADLLRRAAERIALVTGGASIHQVAPDAFAWRSPIAGSDLNDALEALVSIFMPGIEVGGRLIDTQIAIGVCDSDMATTDEAVIAALAAADRAARRSIPWEIYSANEDDAEWRLSLLAELDRAMIQNDLWVAYQPKLDLVSGKVLGAEALVRWNHPERGSIRPDHFIPLVEQSGRIEHLTTFVLETAIRDFSKIPGDMSVAVNISPRMLGRGRLEGPITQLLVKHEFDPSRLTLEITESADLTDAEGISELDRLRALGVSISIDDYGTGQSTLSYFKRLPATELKIDRSFIQLILTSRSDSALVKSTIHLAHELDMKVVAEGVETADVLDALRTMNCDVIQGFHIGKPMPLDDFVAATHGAKDRAAA